MANPNEITVSKQSPSLQSYPNDIGSMPYYCSLHLVEYKRDSAASDLKFQPKGTIVLPIPNELMEAYSIDNNQRDLGKFGGTYNEYMQVAQSTLAAGKAGYENASKLGGLALSAAGGDMKAAGQIFSRDNVGVAGQVLQALSPQILQDRTGVGGAFTRYIGMVPNPHATMIFDGVNLRQHNLSWTFSPRSESDQRRLRAILKVLRVAAHPTYNKVVGRFGLDFPWQIYINFKGLQDQYPIKRSVINSLTINNAPGSEPIFYAGGAPVMINLQMQLTEVEILTQADLSSTWSDDGEYKGASIDTASIQASQLGDRPLTGGGA